MESGDSIHFTVLYFPETGSHESHTGLEPAMLPRRTFCELDFFFFLDTGSLYVVLIVLEFAM